MDTKNSTLASSLAQVLRTKRRHLGLSQAELAQRASLHRTSINEIERGLSNLTLDTLSRLADALGTTAVDILQEAQINESSDQRALKMLLVEDNPADVYMIRRALKNCALPYELKIIEDGSQVLPLLRDSNAENRLPDLILLDINLPKMNGREILAGIRNDDKLKNIPVVVFSTSKSSADVDGIYALKANSYIIKPVDPNQFEQAILKMVEYWFNLVKLPS